VLLAEQDPDHDWWLGVIQDVLEYRHELRQEAARGA
jgi:hypothetical protein